MSFYTLGLSLSMKLYFIHVIDEVRKPHEGGSFVLAQVRADSTWISTCTVVKHDAKLVIAHLVVVSTDRFQKFFHIYSEFKFSFDNFY